MTRDDVTTTLDSLRPEPTRLDERWSRSTLATIMDTPTERPSRRRHRTATLVTGAVGVVLVGTGAAAAAGFVPQTFVEAFGSWGVVSPESEPGTQAVDPATAQRVATSAGPGDTAFTLLAAPGRDGFSCVAVLFETPDSVASPAPNHFVDANGSQCADAPPPDARFGDMGALDVQRQPDVLAARDVRVISVSAGTATRAVVRSDGREHPLLRFEGRFYGWFEGHGDDTPPAVLIGYTDDGAEVGRTRL